MLRAPCCYGVRDIALATSAADAFADKCSTYRCIIAFAPRQRGFGIAERSVVDRCVDVRAAFVAARELCNLVEYNLGAAFRESHRDAVLPVTDESATVMTATFVSNLRSFFKKYCPPFAGCTRELESHGKEVAASGFEDVGA